MRWLTQSSPAWILLVLAVVVAAACAPEVVEQVTIPPPPVTDVATRSVSTETSIATVATKPEVQATPVLPTPEPTITVAPTPTLGPAVPESDIIFQVVFVEQDDVLNVRSGPGVENDIVGSMAPDFSGILITGSGQDVAGSTWYPIDSGELNGWVNGRFLSEHVEPQTFCSEESPRAVVDSLLLAVANRDGDSMAQLVPDGRSLRIRRHWWNPEVAFSQEDVRSLFVSEESYYWGSADGTGDPINGSFREVILPLMDRNLVPATETGCNEIVHGGTAGIVQLPESYDGINYISAYRPAGPEEIELDWGTWVIGIERWQGMYYLSYLVHYEWEI